MGGLDGWGVGGLGGLDGWGVGGCRRHVGHDDCALSVAS